MDTDGHGCMVCNNLQKQLLCHRCVGDKRLADVRRFRVQITLKRSLLLSKLEEKLKNKNFASSQQLELGERMSSLQGTSSRVAATNEQLARVRSEISALRVNNLARAQQLETASDQLAAKRVELLVHVMPDTLRGNQLRLSMYAEALCLEQQRRVHSLLQVLPLNLAGFRRGASPHTPGACITIMGLRLPQDFKPTVDSQQQAQALGTALGYFATLSCLVAYYLDGPLLYLAASLSSTSVLWAPQSFWNQSAAAPLDILRLHLHSVPACATTAFSGQLSSQQTVSLASLANSTIWGNAAPSGSLRVGKGQHDPELRNALHTLSRNVAALLAHTAGPTLHKLVSDLNVFAKLERLCASVMKGASQPAMAAVSASTTASTFGGVVAESFMEMSCLPEVAAEQPEDYFLIQRPAELQAAVADLEGGRRLPVLLAPLPSADASEAEHWAQAMLTESGGATQLKTAVLRAAAGLRAFRRTL